MEHVFLVPIITDVLHSLENALKDIHSLLELIVFKEELGAHTMYVKMQDLVLNMLKSQQIVKTKSVYPMYIPIVEQLYIGNAPNHMNGMLLLILLRKITLGVHIVLIQNSIFHQLKILQIVEVGNVCQILISIAKVSYSGDVIKTVNGMLHFLM